MAAALALLSSLLWGSADFYGGIATRRMRAVLVVGWSQATGLAVVLVAMAVTAAYRDPTGWLGWAALAGVSGPAGLIAFYRALSIGTVGVLSPIAALGVVIPVLVGLWSGDRPTPLQAVGMVIGLIGAIAASGPELSLARSGSDQARGVGLAALAGLAFGVALLAIQRGADYSPVMTLVGMRAVSVTLFLAGGLVVLATVGQGFGVPLGSLPLLAAVGIGDAVANLTFAYASTLGLASVVAVLGSLYPVVTVLLGRFVLGERLLRVQQVGVVSALAGVVLLATG